MLTSARQIGQPLSIQDDGQAYTIRKIADGRMGPTPGEVGAALSCTPHSTVVRIGLMEFAGVDKAARSKTGVWKMQK